MSKTRAAYWLYGTSAWLALIGPLGRHNYASDDLWGKLSIPAVWFSTGHFPRLDRFSYTAPGAAWIDHEWLSGVVFYGALALGGDLLLSLLKASMIALMVAGAVWAARLHRVSAVWPAALLLVGLPRLYEGLVSTGRPQLFTFGLVSGLLAFLEWTRLTGRFRHLWIVPLVGVVWANLHGGFVAGLGLVLCYAAGEALRRKIWLPYLLAAAVWALAVLLNPYGFQYWRYLFFALTVPRPDITEWGRVVLWGQEDWALKLCFLAAVGAILLTLLRHRGERRPWHELLWPQILVLLASFWQAFRAYKLGPLGILAAAVSIPPLLAPALPERSDQSGRAQLALPAISLAGALLWASGCWWDMHPRFQPWEVQVRDNGYPNRYRDSTTWVYPVEAVRFLEESGGCGNVLTPFRGAEFIYWRLYPRFRVSIDGRLEGVYPMEELRRQLEAGFEGQLDSPALTEADWVIVQRQLQLCAALRGSPLWMIAHEDAEFCVFRRASVPAPREVGHVSESPGGWTPTSAFFRNRDRFKGYASETGSPRASACASGG